MGLRSGNRSRSAGLADRRGAGPFQPNTGSHAHFGPGTVTIPADAKAGTYQLFAAQNLNPNEAVQNPIRVGDFSQPQPDRVLLRPRPDFYAERRPFPTDVLLAGEVADTSLGLDLRPKAPLYVASGLPEVWVVDLPGRILHVFRSGTQQERGRAGPSPPRPFPSSSWKSPPSSSERASLGSSR